MADATNSLSSFTGRLKAFQNELGKQGVNSVTQLELLQDEEVNQIYLDLMQSGNQHLADLIGNTSDSDLVQGNAAVVNPESLSIDETLLRNAAQRWGIDIDPDMPQIWRDKKAGVNKRINGDVKNFDKTSLMEFAASMFFEEEEQRTQLASSGVTYQYQMQLDDAVPASSPKFLDWFQKTMGVWTSLPAGYRSQFLTDLQRTDEQAWADLIHECIYEPGERPSDRTEIIPDPVGQHPLPLPKNPGDPDFDPGNPAYPKNPGDPDFDPGNPDDPKNPGDPDFDPGDPFLTDPPPPPPVQPDPSDPQTPSVFGPSYRHPVIRPEDSPRRDSSFGQYFEHPLDPEAWERHGLGFLRTLTPGFMEDWLMENYNKEASAKRRAEEYGVS